MLHVTLGLGPGDCDFEQDSCHCCCWQNQVVGDHNEWGRGRGATPTYGTGPDDDHTYGNSTGRIEYQPRVTPNDDIMQHLLQVITCTSRQVQPILAGAIMAN